MNMKVRLRETDSPLNKLPRYRSSLNEIGRARVSADGTLRDGEDAQHSVGANDRNYLVAEGFLNAATCDALCAAFRVLSARIVNRISGFWDGRFLWHSDLSEGYPHLVEQMRNAQRSAAELVADFYGLTRPIFPDLLQLMSWPVGIHMPPHADNANPDGSPHPMAHRDFSGILYLNDDYEGGELYFTALNTVIEPKKGMLVAFTAGFYHEHAVLRVERNQRLTMPFFFTFDRGRADPSLL